MSTKTHSGTRRRQGLRRERRRERIARGEISDEPMVPPLPNAAYITDPSALRQFDLAHGMRTNAINAMHAAKEKRNNASDEMRQINRALDTLPMDSSEAQLTGEDISATDASKDGMQSRLKELRSLKKTHNATYKAKKKEAEGHNSYMRNIEMMYKVPKDQRLTSVALKGLGAHSYREEPGTAMRPIRGGRKTRKNKRSRSYHKKKRHTKKHKKSHKKKQRRKKRHGKKSRRHKSKN